MTSHDVPSVSIKLNVQTTHFIISTNQIQVPGEARSFHSELSQTSFAREQSGPLRLPALVFDPPRPDTAASGTVPLS